MVYCVNNLRLVIPMLAIKPLRLTPLWFFLRIETETTLGYIVNNIFSLNISLIYIFTTMYHVKYSQTTAYGISVCQRMIIRSHTQIYVWGTLGIRCVLSKYTDKRRCTFKIVSVCEP